MTRLVLSPPVFAIWSALIEEKIGLHYDPSNSGILGDKLSARAAEAGFDSLLDYYYYLRYDPGGAAEFDNLIDVLVVGETYFFRELAPLVDVVREVVRPLVDAGRRPRIWSAACAGGEEPFTLAMLVASEGLRGRVEIVASDVSARALARARAGDFGPRSLRGGGPLPEFSRPWIEPRGERIAVHREILDAVDFRRVNLLDEAGVAELGLFDAIVCRNVLIYFQDRTARRVLDALAGALSPGGALLVGVSESLLRFGSALACEERDGVFRYRKAGPP